MALPARKLSGLLEAAIAVLDAEEERHVEGPQPAPLGAVVPAWMHDLWAGQAGALLPGRTCLVELPDGRRVRMRLHEAPGGGLVWRRDREAEAAYLAERRAQAALLGVEWDEGDGAEAAAG